MSKLKKMEKAKKEVEEDTVSSAGATDGSNQKTTTFKTYDLTGVPEPALPMAHQAYKGNHSYTVWIQGCAPQPQVVLCFEIFQCLVGVPGHFCFIISHGEKFSRAQAIEVLCKQQAYYIKKSIPGTPKPSSYQVSWSKHGGAVEAWNEACRRAGLSAVEQ